MCEAGQAARLAKCIIAFPFSFSIFTFQETGNPFGKGSYIKISTFFRQRGMFETHSATRMQEYE